MILSLDESWNCDSIGVTEDRVATELGPDAQLVGAIPDALGLVRARTSVCLGLDMTSTLRALS